MNAPSRGNDVHGSTDAARDQQPRPDIGRPHHNGDGLVGFSDDLLPVAEPVENESVVDKPADVQQQQADAPVDPDRDHLVGEPVDRRGRLGGVAVEQSADDRDEPDEIAGDENADGRIVLLRQLLPEGIRRQQIENELAEPQEGQHTHEIAGAVGDPREILDECVHVTVLVV